MGSWAQSLSSYMLFITTLQVKIELLLLDLIKDERLDASPLPVSIYFMAEFHIDEKMAE